MNSVKYNYWLILAGICFALFSSLASCSKDDDDPIPGGGGNGGGQVVSADPLITDNGWTLDSTFGELPAYIRIYKSPDSLANKKAVAYVAVADQSDVTFKALGNPIGLNTPDQLYEANGSTVIMNGGLFSNGASVCLLCKDNVVKCPNSLSSYRDGNTYYLTKGAFALMQNGSYETAWVYSIGALTYSYARPAANVPGETPKAKPTATYPEGARVWKPAEGVGAGPVLIKDSVIRNTYVEEFWDVLGPNTSSPRSAIGATGDGRLIFFVCEGRNQTPGVAGLTFQEEAEVLLSIGCTQAMNLDGGGSTCMLVNGKETVQPSDGVQRSVVTAVAMN